MKIYYLTGSQIPSMNANTINVLSMCFALSKYSKNLEFFFSSKQGTNKENIKNIFGISLNEKINLNFVNFDKYHEILIFFKSLKSFIRDFFFSKIPDVIICRNIYGAFFYSFFLKKITYETHTIEQISMRKFLQKKILNKKNVLTVVITQALKNKLISNYKLNNTRIIILPDASFSNLKKNNFKNNYSKNIFKIGYFGHLYKGRGIDLIINLAKKLYRHKFYVVGGDTDSILNIKKKSLPSNLIVLGHQNFKKAKEIMANMDLLLCPYQKKVFLKDQKTSTSSIMSPLKIFEYMSTKKPIICSNLNVLREVLRHNVNCYLANPSNISEWIKLIEKINKDKRLSNTLSIKAYLSFKHKYTWDIRVNKLLINL